MKLARSIRLARTARPRAKAPSRIRAMRVPPLRRAAFYTAFALASMAGSAAYAAASPDATPEAPEADLNIKAQPADQWTGVWTRETLLGDIGGIRPWLALRRVWTRESRPGGGGRAVDTRLLLRSTQTVHCLRIGPFWPKCTD